MTDLINFTEEYAFPDLESDDDIEQVLREIRHLDKEVVDIERRVSSEIDRLKGRLIEIADPKLDRIMHLKSMLIRYHEAKGIKSQHYATASVTVAKGRSSLEASDTAIEWCEENFPEGLNVKTTVAIKAIKDKIVDGKIVSSEGEVFELDSTPFDLVESESSLRLKFIEEINGD